MKGYIYDELANKGFLDDCFEYYVWLRIHERRFLSFYNTALLFLQRPFLVDFATDMQWKKRGRYIKPGANPLIMIVPNGPVGFVYERNDTYSDSEENEKSPEELKQRIYAHEEEYNAIADNCLIPFQTALDKIGISYSEQRSGERLKGHAQLIEHSVKFLGKTASGQMKEVWSHYAIVVNSVDTPVEKAKTILHEIGHILCGHLGEDKDNTLTKVKKRKHEDLSLSTKEIEAELTCDLLCRMLGYPNDSREYIRYYQSIEKKPDIWLEAVFDAAEFFFNALEPFIANR